jgi:hypothetical protein
MDYERRYEQAIEALLLLAFHDRAACIREKLPAPLELQEAEAVLWKHNRPHSLQKKPPADS